jgi:hypothetical protein
MMRRELVLLLLLTFHEAVLSAFTPFLGCDKDLAFGIPVGEECYAVDNSICKFKYPSGCEQVTASVLYYNGGERADDSFTYEPEVYEELTFTSSNGRCGTGSSSATSTCSVSVNSQTCQKCIVASSANFKQITVNCDNIRPAVLQAGDYAINLVRGGGHIPLVVDTTRCQHPAIADRISMPLQVELVYTFGSRVTGTISDQVTQALVDKTQAYYQQLLRTRFPLAQTIDMSDWKSRFTGSGAGGTLTLTVTRATVMWDPAATTATVADIAPVMTQANLLNGAYLAQYVKTANPIFQGIATIAGTVKELR